MVSSNNLFSRNHPTLLLIKKRRSTDATGGFLSRKLFVKIFQYSQENTWFEVSFNKVAGPKASNTDPSLWILGNF